MQKKSGQLMILLSAVLWLGCYHDKHPPEILSVDGKAVMIDDVTAEEITIKATVSDIDDDVTSVQWRYISPKLLSYGLGWQEMELRGSAYVGGDGPRAIVSVDTGRMDEIIVEVRASDAKGNRTTKYYTIRLTRSIVKPSQPPPATNPSGLSDVVVSKRDITITVWDHAEEDGDQIDLIVNDKVILNNFVLKNEKHSVKITLKGGNNKIVIHADNEGDFFPNTAAIAISDVKSGKPEQVWVLELGQDANFTITAP